jgi:hypothetical protein
MHKGWGQTLHMLLINFGIVKQVSNTFAISTMTSNPGTGLFMALEYADKKVCHFDKRVKYFQLGQS